MHLRDFARSCNKPSWVLCNIGYPSETHLKPKSHEISFAHNLWSIIRSFWNSAESTVAILPCFVQNFKTITQQKRMLWTNEVWRDLSFRWVSDGYSILHSTPGVLCNIEYPSETHLKLKSRQTSFDLKLKSRQTSFDIETEQRCQTSRKMDAINHAFVTIIRSQWVCRTRVQYDITHGISKRFCCILHS